jgi:hypothetical protein
VWVCVYTVYVGTGVLGYVMLFGFVRCAFVVHAFMCVFLFYFCSYLCVFSFFSVIAVNRFNLILGCFVINFHSFCDSCVFFGVTIMSAYIDIL